MIIDKRLKVSSLQELTGTSLVPSTDVIDLGAGAGMVGPGEPLWFVIAARVGLAGTTPTLKAAIQTDDASNFPSPQTLVESQTLAQAAFAAGALLIIPMTFNNERFLRLAYTMAGTSPTATVDAWLTNQDPTTWKSFPDGI